MDFAVLAPEVNSGRMYAGPGSGSMMAAAAAWDGLAAELRATATLYSSVISGLTAEWLGPSSGAMAAAAAPYTGWISATAAQAEQAAAQARAAAAAYQTAFAATVPPPVIAANRSQLASLVATNLVGQNTPAIAATEAQYADMWAQDAAAMYSYAGSAAAATQLTPFTEPPRTTNSAGAAGQGVAVSHALGAAGGSNADSAVTQLMSAVPQALQVAAISPADTSSSISTIAGAVQSVGGFVSGPAQASVVVTIISSLAVYAQNLGGILDAAGPAAASTPAFGALTAGLESATPAAGFGAAGSTASTGMGTAGVVGPLSVPPSWAAATPTVRMARRTAKRRTNSNVCSPTCRRIRIRCSIGTPTKLTWIACSTSCRKNRAFTPCICRPETRLWPRQSRCGDSHSRSQQWMKRDPGVASFAPGQPVQGIDKLKWLNVFK